MNPAYTQSLNVLIDEFGKLPGIGPKSAERLAFHILKSSPDQALALARAIADLKQKIRQCKVCFNLSEQELCPICGDPRRDTSILCIVEQPKDIVMLEKTGLCKWIYHVLNGHIAPLEGIEPSDLTIDALVGRIRAGKISEVVMATNPNVDGDATALYIASLLRVKVTRLARGLPTGSTLEYAGGNILADAILGRSPL